MLTVDHDSSTFLALSRFSYSSSMRLCKATLCAIMSSSAAVRARLSRSLNRLSHLSIQQHETDALWHGGQLTLYQISQQHMLKQQRSQQVLAEHFGEEHRNFDAIGCKIGKGPSLWICIGASCTTMKQTYQGDTNLLVLILDTPSLKSLARLVSDILSCTIIVSHAAQKPPHAFIPNPVYPLSCLMASDHLRMSM